MVQVDPDLIGAVKAAVFVLHDGKWHPSERINTIAHLYCTTPDFLCQEIGIALSDSKKWCCLAFGDGPLMAPDGS